MEPQLQLEYRYSSLRFLIDYSMQFYARKLSSQLCDQKLEWLPVDVIGRSFVEWAPSASHLLTLGSSLSLKRPSFLQLCWYNRQGSDPSQLIHGNPDLLPSRTVSNNLTWRFGKGRFGLTTVTTYDYLTRKFEQVFNNQKIDGMDYSIFSWINSDYTHSLSQSLQLSWKGRIVTANVQAIYQHKWMKDPKLEIWPNHIAGR